MQIDENLVMLGVLVVLFGVLWQHTMKEVKAELTKNREQAAVLPATISGLAEGVANAATIPSFNLEELKDDLVDILEDLVQETMGNMQMPTAQDHIFGAISNIIQHKMMQSAPPGLAEMLPALNEEVSTSDIHGSEEIP